MHDATVGQLDVDSRQRRIFDHVAIREHVVLAAALDGIQRGLDPGEPVNEDPGNFSDKERERRGIRRYPTTSGEALDELERDEVLMNALGKGLATEYLKVRRAEAAAYAEKDEAFELDQHFFKY